MQKQFAEVQTIKKKENHREELERKVRDTHRMLMHDYPVYYDWWLQDGNDAKDIKDGKDVNWFRGSFSRQLSLRMQKLNITTAVNDTPESIEAAFHFGQILRIRRPFIATGRTRSIIPITGTGRTSPKINILSK